LLARAILGDVQPQRTAGDLSSVNLLHCLGGVFRSGESDERESTRPTGFAILGNVNIHYFTDFAKQLPQLLIGRAVVEVPYEYLT